MLGRGAKRAISEYRYELRLGNEMIATGHLTQEEPLKVGDRITIGSRTGIVREVDPLFGDHELRLVLELSDNEFRP